MNRNRIILIVMLALAIGFTLWLMLRKPGERPDYSRFKREIPITVSEVPTTQAEVRPRNRNEPM